MKDVFNRRIGFVVCGFEGTVGLNLGIGPMMEQAVGEGPTEALMEEQEEKRRAEAFVGEAIRIAVALAFKEAVPAKLAEIVPELVEPVLLGGGWNWVTTACWSSVARRPAMTAPPSSSTSMRRIMRGS